MALNIKTQQRDRRRARIRARISGTADRPRLSVFKSNTALSVQLIDDVSGKTLAFASTKTVTGKKGLDQARACGAMIAEKALGLNVKTVVFDRGGYIYTGKVEALASGAREAGLQF